MKHVDFWIFAKHLIESLSEYKRDRDLTSAPIEALNCNFPPCLNRRTNQLTNRRTDRRGFRKATLPIKKKSCFVINKRHTHREDVGGSTAMW